MRRHERGPVDIDLTAGPGKRVVAAGKMQSVRDFLRILLAAEQITEDQASRALILAPASPRRGQLIGLRGDDVVVLLAHGHDDLHIDTITQLRLLCHDGAEVYAQARYHVEVVDEFDVVDA